MLNSPLMNCWLRLNNAADTLTLASLLLLPIPASIDASIQSQIEDKVNSLAVVWRRTAIEGPSDERLAAALTLTNALDKDIYTLYQVPGELQREVAQYFVLSGDSRPGFSRPEVVVPELELDGLNAARVSARRMKRLFAARAERALTLAESQELEELVGNWERLNLRSDALLSVSNASVDAR